MVLGAVSGPYRGIRLERGSVRVHGDGELLGGAAEELDGSLLVSDDLMVRKTLEMLLRRALCGDLRGAEVSGVLAIRCDAPD